MSQPDRDAELRRLRAALGAAAAESMADPDADPARLLAAELDLIERLLSLSDPTTSRRRLMALWHDLRLRSTALAADAPPTEEALALLRRYVGREERR
jgi:hypothetical protein